MGFAIGKMLRQDGWAEKYDPKNQFHVNQYDYTSCKDYLSALREKWQDYEDPECELEEYVNVNNYSNYDDYAYDVDVYRTRLEWRNELDPDNEFGVSPWDFEYKEYYVNALKRAWKKEYDPYDEFKHIDLKLIDDVNEYKEQVETYREWIDAYGDYNLDPSEYDEEEEQDKPRFLGRSNPKVVPMRRSMEVTMIKPTSMEDSRDICDYLLAGKAVVLNMEGIHTEVAQRIIDFTSGATYSMNGNLQKISNYIFIATPDSVELSGDFQDILAAGSAMGMDVSGLNIHL